MDTITRKYNLYHYGELKEQAKQKVQQMFGEDPIDETSMPTEDFEMLIEQDNPYFTNPKFQWSLGHCQGDGLSFSCGVDVLAFVKAELESIKKPSVQNVISNYLTIRSTGNKGRYCYASNNDIDFNFETDVGGNIEQVFDSVIKAVQNKYMSVCAKFEKIGYEQYAYRYSDENAQERSEGNDYTYLEDGTDDFVLQCNNCGAFKLNAGSGPEIEHHKTCKPNNDDWTEGAGES